MKAETAKSCMSLSEEKVTAIRQQLLESDALSVVGALKQMGLTKSEALGLIERYWEQKDE